VSAIKRIYRDKCCIKNESELMQLTLENITL